ncbi:MAG: hypothetical protein D4R65_06735 [Verrucomicrobiaceae bacterium]|nr:MAG: hypothetical protein D4R65_06735 [Verrucomicrobiaceae bacterium]
MKPFHFLQCAGPAAAMFFLLGGAAPVPAAGPGGVTLAYDQKAGCYRVDFDLTAVTHREAGRQYAAAIRGKFPKFETLTDRFLQETIDDVNKGIADPARRMTFAKALTAANALRKNIPRDYREEIDGMGLVFSWPVDKLGDGHLSANENFVSLIFEDVTQAAACSAAAVFGRGSDTGRTIVGRNNDWPPNKEMDSWNAMFVFHNGDRSSAGNGMIGELFPNNVFNRHHLFGGSLDSWPASEPSIPRHGARSPTIDLRWVIENSRTLAEAEKALARRDYGTGSLILLADADTAHVLEYDTSRPSGQRGKLRSSTTKLRDGITWDLPDAIASVNSFLLPGAFPNHVADAHNHLRLESFRKLLRRDLGEGPVTLGQMKDIMGYTSRDGCAATSGALFRLGIKNDSATFQSLVMRMDSFETWMAYSAYGAKWPYRPVYHKIFSGDPFR